MSVTTPPPDDPVIAAVKLLSAGYNNSNYAKRQPQKLGPGRMYTVTYQGQDGKWYEDYVFEVGSTRRAYHDVPSLISDPENRLFPKSTRIDNIRLGIVSALTIMFAIAVVYVVIKEPKNESLQVLTGLLGLTIGYFVGRADTPAAPAG